MPPTGQRQTLMFSATFPKEIQRLAADFLSNYVFLTVGRVGSSTDLIVQHLEYVPPGDKQNTLLDLITSVSGPEQLPVSRTAIRPAENNRLPGYKRKHSLGC